MPAWGGHQSGGHDALVASACALLSFGVFCFDLSTPTNTVPVGLAYGCVIFLTAFSAERRLHLSYAAVTSVLIMVGRLLPPPPADEAVVVLGERALAVVVLWLIAGVIHHRARAEAALVGAREAGERAAQAKSRFLATMSHELRAPLTGILGFSEILKSEMLGPIGNARYAEYAGHIHESGEHMLSLINDLLDIAKIEVGAMEIDPEWLHVRTLFKPILDGAAGRVDAKGLTLTLEASDALQLHADARAVQTMTRNLLSNAITFTPEGGRITIGAIIGADGGVALSVRDTGVGLSHEAVSRLLRPFDPADVRFGAARTGAGLGLSLVKGLIGLHRGGLTIESQVGRGSTFTLRFPPAPVQTPAPRGVGAAAPKATAAA